jgi:hypothetical protein
MSMGGNPMFSPFEKILTLVSESEECSKKVQQQAVWCSAVHLSFQHGKQYVGMRHDAMYSFHHILIFKSVNMAHHVSFEWMKKNTCTLVRTLVKDMCE